MANEQNKFPQNPSTASGTAAEKNTNTSNTTTTGQTKTAPVSSNTAAGTQTKKENPISHALPATSRESSTFGTDRDKDTGKSLMDQAKDTAGQAYEAASEKAVSKIDDQKLTFASGLTSVADSVRQVGQNLKGTDVNDGIAKYTAEYSDTAAKKIEQVANYFERKDVKEMFRDVESFARSNPAIFIGGAFTLGIIAARFLKSSSPKYLTKTTGQNFGSERRPFNEGFSKSETQPPAKGIH
ncbi:MAG: hypothetical protein H0V90_09170 [Blastocatellia bacterium]|nr:hypothetical protein [Blastocatellia bacterium]MDQ3220162.1 hypothetical protein [Acidobacteriota bacterium]